MAGIFSRILVFNVFFIWRSLSLSQTSLRRGRGIKSLSLVEKLNFPALSVFDCLMWKICCRLLWDPWRSRSIKSSKGSQLLMILQNIAALSQKDFWYGVRMSAFLWMHTVAMSLILYPNTALRQEIEDEVSLFIRVQLHSCTILQLQSCTVVQLYSFVICTLVQFYSFQFCTICNCTVYGWRAV